MARRKDLKAHARRLHRETLVADIHTHMLLSVRYLGFDVRCRRRRQPRWSPLRNMTDLITIERAIAGGLGLLVFTIYVFPTPWRRYRRAVLRTIDSFLALMDRYRGRAAHARSIADVSRIRSEGQLACMLALEGGHALEGDLAFLETLRERGITYLTLTHFINNELSGSSTHPGSAVGLTPFGREVVRECNRLGILLDLSHCSEVAKLEAASLSRQPVICSHTGLRRFVGASRMASDAEVRVVAETGGLIGLMVSPLFVNGTRNAGVDDVVRGLAHVVEIAGEDHVCLGSDLDSGFPPPQGMEDIGDFQQITEALVRSGFSDALIRKIWAENFLGLLERVGW
ncbi:dipeptidase [Planctomycetota bacterium]